MNCVSIKTWLVEHRASASDFDWQHRPSTVRQGGFGRTRRRDKWHDIPEDEGLERVDRVSMGGLTLSPTRTAFRQIHSSSSSWNSDFSTSLQTGQGTCEASSPAGTTTNDARSFASRSADASAAAARFLPLPLADFSVVQSCKRVR